MRKPLNPINGIFIVTYFKEENMDPKKHKAHVWVMDYILSPFCWIMLGAVDWLYELRLVILAIISALAFIGIPTEDGLLFGYFWKLCWWLINL